MPTFRQIVMSKVLRLYPLYSGSGSLANHALVLKLAGESKELAWAKVHGGYFAPAPLDDYVGRAVYYSGELDRKITWVISKVVRPGDLVLDIGANLGLISMILAKLVQPSGKVLAFEPIPYMQTLIRKAIEKNGINNIELFPIALGASPGLLTLNIPQGHFGRSSLVQNYQGENCESCSVPVETLSDIMRRGKFIQKIRLIKIDVEGFEPEVLKGAKEVFELNKPDVILFESNLPDKSNDPSFAILGSYGYNFLSLPKAKLKMKIKPFLPSTPTVAHDFIAVRQGSTYDEITKLLM